MIVCGEKLRTTSAAEQPAEHEHRVPAGGGAREHEPADMVAFDQLAQVIRERRQALTVPADAPVIPGLLEIAHEQPFERAAPG